MNDFSWWVAKWWIAAIFGGVLAFAKWAYKKIKENRKKRKEAELQRRAFEAKKYDELIQKLAANTTANVVIVYDRLSQAYQHFQERGYCTMQDRHNCMKMFNVYKSLGGNDNMEDMMDRLMALKISDQQNM